VVSQPDAKAGGCVHDDPPRADKLQKGWGFTIQYNTIQTKFVKRHVAVASEALANRTVKKHRQRRTNVL